MPTSRFKQDVSKAKYLIYNILLEPRTKRSNVLIKLRFHLSGLSLPNILFRVPRKQTLTSVPGFHIVFTCMILSFRGLTFTEKKINFVPGFTLFARSFRRRFFAYYYAVNHPHTNIIISLFSIPLVLKCATKILKIGLQIKI